MSYYSLFNVLHKEKKAHPPHSSYAQTSICNGADGGSWTRDLILTKDALYHWATLATKIFWSGKRDSNPRPPAWKASALSTELFPRNPKHSSVSARGLVSASNCEVPKDPCKISATQFFALIKVVGADGFEPPKLKSSRFTVCPIWPLWNTPKTNYELRIMN